MDRRRSPRAFRNMSTRAAVLVALLLWVARPFAVAPFAAQDTQANPSHRFAPGACGPVDPSYIHIAEESGGQPMFLQRTEVAQAGHFMREMSAENHETLLWAKGVLQGEGREFAVPVDASVERVTFTLSTDTKGAHLTVLDPGGAEFTASHAGAQISDLNCGRIVTAAEPERGEWRMRVSGSGRFWVQAGARSEIFLTGVQFVAEGGRPGHEGMFRIAGQPLAGRPATLETNLSGPAKNARFELISEEGDAIKRVEMRSYH